MNILKAIKAEKQCIYALGGKIENGELSLFCEVTNEFENVSQNECIGSCSMQKGVNQMKNFEIGQVVYVYFDSVLSLEEAVVLGFKDQYVKVKYAFGTNYKIKDEIFATRQECIDYANSRHNDRVADFKAEHGTKEGMLRWMYDNIGDMDSPFAPEKEALKELIKTEFGVEV